MIMIIIYISGNAWRPSNHQIINYDMSIVLIDLHQLNVKTTRQYKSATLNTGQPPCQRRTEPAEQQPATSAVQQMIEQINIALEQKRVREFLSLGH